MIDGSTGWKEHRGAVRSELPHRGRPHNDRWLRGLVEVELNEGLGNTGDDSYRCLTTVLQHGEPGCGLAWKLARGKARERGGKTRQDASWRWLDSSYILLDASWNTIVPESFGLWVMPAGRCLRYESDLPSPPLRPSTLAKEAAFSNCTRLPPTSSWGTSSCEKGGHAVCAGPSNGIPHSSVPWSGP